MLVLDNDDVRKVFDVSACLGALEQAYRSQAEGRTITGLRSQSYMPLAEAGLSYCLKTMEGALPESGYMVLRLTSDIVSEQRVRGIMRRALFALPVQPTHVHVDGNRLPRMPDFEPACKA